jgi:hypothetical protein
MSSSIENSQNEQNLLEYVLVILSTCSITGLATYVVNTHNSWVQFSIVLHLLTGIACSLILSAYVYIHFRRATGVRRPSTLISGLFTAIIFIAFTITGLWITYQGQKESEAWVYELHVLTSIIFLIFIALHLFLHSTLLPKRRKDRAGSTFPNITSGFMLRFTVTSSFIIAIIPLVSYLYDINLSEYAQASAVNNYEYSYGNSPFRPSETETTSNTFIDKRQIGNSHRCMNCHEDITRQWMASAHREAALDPTYVSNINLLEQNRGISATRYCEGCHAPVALLSGELSPGGKHGGVSNTHANEEGVSCMSCHGIESLVHLKGVASFRFKPKQDYLFAQSEHPLLTRLHDWILRVRPDQHIKDMGRSISKESKFCSSCHTQFMDKDMNNWGWIKMQDEYTAWLESPYSKQHEESFSSGKVTRCQDCHMPLQPSNDPSADSKGLIRSHHFPGSNTVLPLLRNDQKQYQATREFLQSNKLNITIDKPHRKDSVRTMTALDENMRRTEGAPYYYYLGEKANMNIVVSNRGVGHDFPGGTIDINEAWIEFLVMDAEGHLVFSSGEIGPDNNVDPQAYFYHSLPIDKGGNLVWKHDLFNMVGESFRRVIKAGESDIVNYQFMIPSWTKPPLTVTATLKYRKLNNRYAKWALKKQYIEIPVVDLAWSSLNIPVKIRKEVE